MSGDCFSNSLREALGLQQNQLPSYIYMMRQLGYPPGWLEATVQHTSGLAMFDRHGKGKLNCLICGVSWMNDIIYVLDNR